MVSQMKRKRFAANYLDERRRRESSRDAGD
jgi:hypothetical protein